MALCYQGRLRDIREMEIEGLEPSGLSGIMDKHVTWIEIKGRKSRLICSCGYTESFSSEIDAELAGNEHEKLNRMDQGR